jgi:anaerobic selenocysteine-containing dehydrogenase
VKKRGERSHEDSPKGGSMVQVGSEFSNNSSQQGGRTASEGSGRSDERYQPVGSERRLFEDGVFYHADGRAKFLFDAPRAMPEMTSAEFPMVLLTGRGTSAQWHTNTRTEKSAILRKLYPAKCYIELHPDDAAALSVTDQERVVVESKRGSIGVTAVLTSTVQRGQCFMPMHYEEVNKLTFAAFDPHSRQPSYKACAVRVSSADSWCAAAKAASKMGIWQTGYRRRLRQGRGTTNSTSALLGDQHNTGVTY